MRSAEIHVEIRRVVRSRTRAMAKTTLVAGAIAFLAGCASVEALKEKVLPSAAAAPGSAASAGAGTAVKSIGTTTAAVIAAPVDAAPVDPTTQRTFDDANRALRAGRAADAERGYRALIQSHPELAGPHANLALIQRRAGRLNDATAELERAVALSPKQPVYLNQLGVSYRQAGKFDKARDAYERALSIDADYAVATLNLGILNDLYLGDAARAAELYQRYLTLTPAGDPAVTKWIAELKNRKAPVAVAERKEKT